MKQILLVVAFATTALFNRTYAQSDSAQSNPLQFKISLNYSSGLNYYGRTDSLKSSGVFPMAELWFTPRVYISAAPVFVHNSLSTLDYAGTVTTLGYQYTATHWFTNAYVMKPFYKESSELVQSALKAQSGISISYLNKIINFTAGGDVKWSDKTDFGVTGGIDHIFRIENKDNSVIVLDPSVYAYAGTQQFTNTYYKKKGGNLLFPGRTQEVTESVAQFVLLACELSVPVIFAKGHIQFQATPSYIMPKNLIAVKNRPDLSEQGSNLFYTTLAVKYTF